MTGGNRLHVHVLIDSLGLGGAESLLADFTIGARAAGVEVSVGYLIGGGEAADRLRELGIEPSHVPVRGLLGRRDRAAVRRHVAAIAPDLLHTHLGYADVLGGLASRALGVSAVSTIHLAGWIGTPRERVMYRLTALARRHCAARVIAVSDAARRTYLETGWDRPERVVTVHNGIVDAAEPGAGAAVRRELGIAPDELVVAMVGVLRGWKGHEPAADAVRTLLGRFPRVRLLIVGDGPRRGEIEAAVGGLGERVLFTGYRHDVAAVLDAADVLLHPSLYDAFPTALLEAMAAGVPVVATAVGGIPEAVAHGETGFLISPPATAESIVEPLRELLGDPALRRRMGVRGRARFESEFRVDRWLERLLGVYDLAMR